MEKKIKIETREWAPGDLVGITKCDSDGHTQSSMGVVLREVGWTYDTQTHIFPSVLVFDMSAARAVEYYIYELDLMSAA